MRTCKPSQSIVDKKIFSLLSSYSASVPVKVQRQWQQINIGSANLSTRTTSSLNSVHRSFGQQMRISVFGSSRTLLTADARSLIDWANQTKISHNSQRNSSSSRGKCLSELPLTTLQSVYVTCYYNVIFILWRLLSKRRCCYAHWCIITRLSLEL